MDSAQLKVTFRPFPIPAFKENLGTGLPKTIDQVAEALKAKVGKDAVTAIEKSHTGDPFVVLKKESLVEAVRFLRDDEKFLCSLLQVISAVDYPPVTAPVAAAEATDGAAAAAPAALPGTPPAGTMAVVYVLWSYQHRHQITVKVYLDRDAAKVSTLCDLYRAANWYERECYDMMGIVFEGHPDHQRILLPPDWVGHPLRKDYVYPDEYNGMKVPL